jgi:hypothetical protein
MTLQDLCVAIGILPCGSNYDRIRAIVPRADRDRIATVLMDQRTGTPDETVRCIEVP